MNCVHIGSLIYELWENKDAEEESNPFVDKKHTTIYQHQNYSSPVVVVEMVFAHKAQFGGFQSHLFVLHGEPFQNQYYKL